MRTAISFAPIRRAILAQMREQQERFERDRLGRFPHAWASEVRAEFARRAALDPAAANRWLDAQSDGARGRLDLSADDADVCEAAERAARDGWHLIASLRSVPRVVAALQAHCEAWGILSPVIDMDNPQPAIARMLDPVWWLRRLRRAHGRRVEGAAIAAGLVHRRRWLYASDDTVKRREQQRERNRKAVQAAVMESDGGARLSLAAAVEASTANPEVKHAEFMVRMRGLEGVAQREGHAGEFITITCPSRFHRMRQDERGKVTQNPRWQGATPADAQRYLCKVWARIRAAWARAGIAAYGFRVAEPHHDGCPHWHMLLFIEPARVIDAREIVAHYALQSDGREPGAGRRRVTFKAIDPSKGSAAGYIAKYLSKNISGANVGDDEEAEPGTDARDTVARCDAWAATWGIRQFQQIGAAPVGVWRELRRMGEAVINPLVESLRMAADLSAFDQFVIAMGGALCKRRERPVRVARLEQRSEYEKWLATWGERAGYVPEDGAVPLTQYGDAAAPRAFGVKVREFVRLGIARMPAWVPYRSRWRDWTIKWGSHGNSIAGAQAA